MGAVKDEFIAAIEKSADALTKIVGNHTLPEPLDFAAWKQVMADPNFNAKWTLVIPVEFLRDRAKKLRRGDIKKGDWPPFRPEDAAHAMSTIQRFEDEARAWTKDENFIRSIGKALQPLRDVVEKHASKNGVWRFRDEDVDPLPTFEAPPPAGT